MLLLSLLISEPVPVVVWGIEDIGGSSNVVLVDTAGKRLVLIGVSGDQALAIGLALEGLAYPRPLTHDLFISLLDSLGWKLEKVVVTRLENDIFYSDIYLRKGKKKMVMDARPSDALNLALRAGCRVYVEEDVLDEYTNELLNILQELQAHEEEGIGI